MLVRLSAGAIRSGLPASFGLRASGAFGNYATLSGLVSFGFLVLLVLFFVSHLLHYSCVNVGLFSRGEALRRRFWICEGDELRNTFEGGARVWCFLGVLAFGVLSCILFSWVERLIRLGGSCAIIAQNEGHHVSIKERQSNKQQERHPRRN